jgi:hypothetical protein
MIIYTHVEIRYRSGAWVGTRSWSQSWRLFWPDSLSWSKTLSGGWPRSRSWSRAWFRSWH